MSLAICRMPRRGATLALLIWIALAGASLVPAGAKADACPNAAERFGASAPLPDCRAYELVTPMVKEDNSFLNELYGFPDGQHVTFATVIPLPGSKNGEPQAALSSRTPNGWVTMSIAPAQGSGELENLFTAGAGGGNLFHVAFTSDFSAAYTNSAYADDPLDQNLRSDVYRIAIPSGESSLASLPDTGAMTEALDQPTPGTGPAEAGSYIAGASADGSHVVFTTLSHLPTAPGTPVDEHSAGNEIYERHAGHTYLVGILPDGSVPPCGAEVGNGGSSGPSGVYVDLQYGAVSPDGADVVFHTQALGAPGDHECETSFHAESKAGGLYLRKNNDTPSATTIRLPGYLFQASAADGSKIISIGGPEADPEGEPIFEYDVMTGQATMVGHGVLVAYSADGSHIFYLSYPGGGSKQELKVYADGVTESIPNAGPGYSGEWYPHKLLTEAGIPGNLPVVTSDGSKLLFLDRTDLTSYDSQGPTCKAVNQAFSALKTEGVEEDHCVEAYVYDLKAKSFTCVSCNPSGAPPLTDVQLFYEPPQNDSLLPPIAPLLSEDGSRAFFETSEALVPQDTNGENDVYEWENGHIYLLSSGQGGEAGRQEINGVKFSGVAGSRLIGASSNGDDVFIATTDHLLPQDIENSEQIYDVRVDGGFPYTAPVYGCDSGQCQGPQTPTPIFAPPPSATFVGVGNPAGEEIATTVKPRSSTAKTRHNPKTKPKKKHGRAKRHNRTSRRKK